MEFVFFSDEGMIIEILDNFQIKEDTHTEEEIEIIDLEGLSWEEKLKVADCSFCLF